MTKNLIQDMIPSKGFQKEKLPEGKIKKEKEIDKLDISFLRLPNQKIEDTEDKKKPLKKLWFVALISLIFLFFAFSTLFANAKITIYPKMQDFVLNTNLSASKDSNQNTVLPFSLISLSGEESKTVLDLEEREYKEKAKGTVVIYNNYSGAAQRLSIDTRLVGSNGKIYKTEKEIIVPGMTKIKNAGGVLEDKVGSVSVGIYASEEGAEYNSEPLDFKIFGFQGSPKYTKFYARSDGAIKGGIVGKFKTVKEEDKKKINEELELALKEKLFKKAKDQLPEGYVLFKDAVLFKINEENNDFTLKEEEAILKIKGTLYGFLFEEKKLTKKIAEIVLPKDNDNEVYIPKIEDFVFSLLIELDINNFTDIKNVSFNLSGNSKIVWNIDQGKLVENLKGKSKKDFKQILDKYENIESANLSLYPLWKNTIPKKTKDIKIIIRNTN